MNCVMRGPCRYVIALSLTQWWRMTKVCEPQEKKSLWSPHFVQTSLTNSVCLCSTLETVFRSTLLLFWTMKCLDSESTTFCSSVNEDCLGHQFSRSEKCWEHILLQSTQTEMMWGRGCWLQLACNCSTTVFWPLFLSPETYWPIPLSC